MPTQEHVERLVAEFERQYPESLSDRLKWWAHVVGIDRIRLFRLLGVPGGEAARTPVSALARIVKANEDRAEMVDELLGQLLASFDYDLPAFRQALHAPLKPAAEEEQRVTRRPGSVVALAYTPRARSGILLNEIVAGGPSALPALLAYLREARSGGGGPGTRAR